MITRAEFEKEIIALLDGLVVPDVETLILDTSLFIGEPKPQITDTKDNFAVLVYGGSTNEKEYTQGYARGSLTYLLTLRAKLRVNLFVMLDTIISKLYNLENVSSVSTSTETTIESGVAIQISIVIE